MIRLANIRVFVVVLLLFCTSVLPCVSLMPVRAFASRESKTPAPQQANGPLHKRGELLVRFKPGASQNDKDLAAATQRAKRKQQLRGESSIEKLELPSGDDAVSAAAQLGLNPQVEFAEPNFIITKDQVETTPDDPRYSEQWALRNTGQNGGQYGSDTGINAAWNKTTGAQSTTIAIIDSGVDFSHPDLANNEWTNSNPANGDVHGWDYVTDSADITDPFGHGTAIAGIIAAQGNNGVGTTEVMWRASLMSLRVLDNTGSGDIGDAVEAIDYAVNHGAQVINLSWGTTGESLALKDAIQRAIRRNVVVVCSAGNGGQDLSLAPYYPAAFDLKGLVSVAGSDNFDRLASWSNWGSGVTLAAPGVDILTTRIGGGYGTVSGTSAAAPLVTGVVGLMKSLNPSLDPAKASRTLRDDARQVASLSGKVASGGVVAAAETLAQVRAANASPSPVSTPDYGNSGRVEDGNSNQPPEVNHPDDKRRAGGKDGTRVEPVKGQAKAPLAKLPDLSKSRKNRTSTATSAPAAPIQANLMCTDCDPSGGRRRGR